MSIRAESNQAMVFSFSISSAFREYHHRNLKRTKNNIKRLVQSYVWSVRNRFLILINEPFFYFINSKDACTMHIAPTGALMKNWIPSNTGNTSSINVNFVWQFHRCLAMLLYKMCETLTKFFRISNGNKKEWNMGRHSRNFHTQIIKRKPNQIRTPCGRALVTILRCFRLGCLAFIFSSDSLETINFSRYYLLPSILAEICYYFSSGWIIWHAIYYLRWLHS